MHDESCVEIQNSSNPLKTTFVSIEEATNSVNKFIGATNLPTRSGNKRVISEVITLGGFGESRSANSDEDSPLVYLFNFDNNEGFALVSGDSRVGDIIAFVEDGNLDPNVGIENPGFAIFLEMADAYYRIKTGLSLNGDVHTNYLKTRSDDDPWEDYNPDIDADYVEYSSWEKIPNSDTGGILPCKWDQDYPLNRYCYTSDGESALVGCVAIAVGQIMYFHRHNYSYNGTNYDWSVISGYVKSSGYTYSGLDMAAKLVADLGRPENLDMDYGVEGSGAYTSNVPRTFTNFGYSSPGTVSTSLGFNLNSGPSYVSGTRIAASSNPNNTLGIYSPNGLYSGHAWIIDASMRQRRYIYTYLYNGILAKTEFEDRILYHCNWGWGGTADGYFLGDVFKISECVIPDTTTPNIIWHYDRDITFIKNIHP